MRLFETQITPFINNFLHIESREQPFFYSPLHGQASFHSHPELELGFIQEGFGKRIIGNKVTDYSEGDMVFLGSGVPHVYISDPIFYRPDSKMISRSIVCYIHPKIFEPMLNNLTELASVKDMIDRATRGIEVFGITQKKIGEKLVDLLSKTGFEKVEGILSILHTLSISDEKNFILCENPASTKGVPDRMNDVLEFIRVNLSHQVTLNQVADVACLTVPSFCRFFKQRTKMTFFQYLTRERIAHACKLLIEEDKSVSYIANMCGYNSDSHFCKVFKDHIGKSPHQYKSSVNAAA